MTYVAWKLSNFPPYRVIGSGTLLESARFRFVLSQRLNVAADSVQAFIIGEQGTNSGKFDAIKPFMHLLKNDIFFLHHKDSTVQKLYL